jgi:hypothetical protein
LVLSALKSPPFELANEVDIKFVSYKCCFLLALASGRRSEISLELELDLLCLVLSKYIFNILIGHSRSEEESEGRAGMKIGSESLLGI